MVHTFVHCCKGVVAFKLTAGMIVSERREERRRERWRNRKRGEEGTRREKERRKEKESVMLSNHEVCNLISCHTQHFGIIYHE